RVEIRSLVEARFIAATGGIDREPAT
ncbi:MAG: hypothetical protein JWP92_2988, partial [Caulobacter sp.]|nr:hypothetical protein [Caulobacter sp.]